jgi:molybdopterin-containing oxidoreductase family iron-sulfur binding subunit
MNANAKPLELDEVRARLGAATGRDYWRTLEELADTPAFQELLEREFPGQAGEWTGPVNRRQFLTLMAAGLGLAGLAGCSVAPAPPGVIVPYVRPPEQIVPGRPLYFATAMPLGGDAVGLLAESHEGRPTKVEGNPDHPNSPRPMGSPERVKFGASNLFAQASVLTLYDPERSGAVTYLGEPRGWEAFLTAFGQKVAAAPNGAGGLRLRVLSETITSPGVARQLALLKRAFPEMRWHVHDAVDRANAREGARLAFGQAVEPQYHLGAADVIVSLDADFLDCGPRHLRLLHDFAERRKGGQSRLRGVNRLYVIECTPSGTGAKADHRLPLRATDIEAFARALAARVEPQRLGRLAVAAPSSVPGGWIDALARDLNRNRGSCLVIAGERQPPRVHALAHALNDALGNVGAGKPVTYTAPAELMPLQAGTLAELAQDFDTPGTVDVLVVLGCNPAYTAPADQRFAERLQRFAERLQPAPLAVHLGLYTDETARLCHWQIPEAHFLEAWGDCRAADGTVSLIQPLIAPLHGGKTAAELLAHLSASGVGAETSPSTDRSSYGLLRDYWKALFDRSSPAHRELRAEWERQGAAAAFIGTFDSWWQKTLRDGLMERTQLPAAQVTLRTDWMDRPAPAASADLEIVFQPDPALYDGRFANNGWLQELPRPQTKLTWDNAVLISPAAAVRLGFAPADRPDQANEKVVKLKYQGREVEGPLWVLPGQADNSVVVHLGHGRTAAGRVGNRVGFNAYALRTAGQPWLGTGLTLEPTNRRHSLASTQHQQLLPSDRVIIRSGTVQNPPHIPPPTRLTLYDSSEHLGDPNQWGMVIDLSLCTGCSACVVACQAENNIPVVGKDQVSRGRVMHWLRIDHYYRGEPANPETFFQPVPCMHCENAPCEQVCPVAATVHSGDGLNDMVYNRCVGTRYCSNNCPYKVRRFNFLQFADFETESLRLMRNPEVTVRSRGVMEKCTYCVQRIRAGQIAARVDDRPLADGEVVTACQAACPAGAIVFGDLNADSHAARLRRERTHYALLDELNTRPRTTYLAALKNPNPEMPAQNR